MYYTINPRKKIYISIPCTLDELSLHSLVFAFQNVQTDIITWRLQNDLFQFILSYAVMIFYNNNVLFLKMII